MPSPLDPDGSILEMTCVEWGTDGKELVVNDWLALAVGYLVLVEVGIRFQRAEEAVEIHK